MLKSGTVYRKKAGVAGGHADLSGFGKATKSPKTPCTPQMVGKPRFVTPLVVAPPGPYTPRGGYQWWGSTTD